MQITYIAIFLEGLLSFLSPCVLPLLPLYMSYLAGDNKTIDEEGNVHYNTKKVFVTTLFFVFGIGLTFVLLSLSLGVVSDFLNKYSLIISIIGGTLLILFGLHELGLIRISVLDQEIKIKAELHLEKMNPLKALLLGLVFSIGWSPCIGPMLSNALLMAATNPNGYIYLFLYALGLTIPFLFTGLLTTTVLNFFNKNKKIVNAVLKISGIVLILFGSYMIVDASKKITSISKDESTTRIDQLQFIDEKGIEFTLEEYHGKYIFINFATTWCTYCKQEMPEFESFAKENDVVCIYAMTPLAENSQNAIASFIEEYKPGLRILIDNNGTLFYGLNITSYPQTYVISPDGNLLAYTQGAMNIEGFENLFNYAKELYETK